MRETRVGRNNPCPYGSGRKFKHCCLRGFSQPVSPRAGGPPDRIASVTTYAGSPHPPNQKCKVFDPQTRRWRDTVFKEIQPGQEFIADNRLYKMWSRDVTAHLDGLDVSRILDAERPYDPANSRTPKANDVVLVLGDKYPNCGHWLLGHLNPGQRCLFQGRVYAIEADDDPRNCKLVGTDLLLVKRPPRLPEQDEAIFRNVVVRETRLTCAPMPAYQGLEGTLTPPTPEEFRAKYEEIQQGDSIAPTEMIFHYTHPEPFGYAEVELLVAADEFFCLPNGASVSVLDVKPGMEVRLTDGAVGKITRRQTCFDIPEPPEPVENGLWVSRVTARVKHTALQVLQWRLGDLVIEGTPGHLVWSVTRRGWVRACELQPGEFVRPVGNVVVPVESVGPLKTGRVEVYGIEVEFFHNYFVGRGDDSMLVHNGLDCVNKPARAESGKLASGSKVGLGGDRKFAVGWDAIFGPKEVHVPSGALAGKKVGHTFTKHGSHNTHELAMEAKNSRRPVGQWTDDAAAEAFVGSKLPELKQGAKTFDLPSGLGRQLNPDGSYTPANRVRLVPSKSGVKTAFPFFEE